MKKNFSSRFTCLLAALSLSWPVLAQSSPAKPPVPAVAVHQQQSQEAVGDVVNINTADVTAIVEAHLKGIGEKRAAAIVSYREKNGPFKSVDDLKNVKGISQKIIDANRDRLRV